MSGWADPAILMGMVGTGSTILGGVIWAVRLEGRQTVHEAVDTQREELHDERHEDMKSRLDGLSKKLEVLDRMDRTLARINERL
jgi:hypothetical protein